MGASAKILSRLVSLHERGLLKNGASIIELGAQELYCSGMEDYVAGVIRYFSERNPAIKKPEAYTGGELARFANKGLLGNLLKACGFAYRALDIFEAENTILFDLNIHSPGEDLYEQVDLVTNFGTTEHVINQYQAMKTMHELAKPGGLIYHDLPLAGYHNHGYFSYNPLFFHHLAVANSYKISMQHYSKGGRTAAPAFMIENGYPESHYVDCGIELIVQKTSSGPFRMPLETSTSLGISKTLWGDANPYVNQGPGLDADFDASVSTSAVILAQASGRDLQRELVRRYRRKLSSLLKLR